MHFRDHVMMIDIRHVLKKRVTVDVHCSSVEGVLRRPRGSVNAGRYEMYGFNRVVKIREVNISISIIHGLEL